MSKRQAPPKPARRPPVSEPAPPPAEEIPEGLEADFAPLRGGDKPLSGEHSDPYHRDSLQSQQEFDAAAEAAGAGREDEAVRRFLTASKLAERAHEWYLAALSFRRVGDFLLNPKPPCDLERAFRMYRRAVDAYERCGLVDEARALTYYQLRLMTARGREMNLSVWRRAELWLYWAVAGYGLRPIRVVGTAASIILLFGVLYWLLGGAVEASTKVPAGLWESIYFSGITFATVGYGDFLPTPSTRPLALLEGMLGALTMGFFVVVLANRLRR